MKAGLRAAFGPSLLIVVLLVAACPNPISSARGGVLRVSINNNINARTLLPPIDMIAASFTVLGTGPGSATFSQTTSGAPVTLDDLAFGAWSVTVNALNSAGTIIGSGQTTVTVHTGQTATVNITVVPLAGNGTLDLTVTWTASQVENASILASLTPPVGASTPLSFGVSGVQATYSSTTIPAGYQTLTVQLVDGVMPVMGAVEVVRIVAGQTTTGAYTFANVNQPGGAVQVNITPAMAEPIPVSISGVSTTVSAGAGMTATASVSDGTANVNYVWYLNGVSAGMGAAYTLPSTVSAGYYRLDVTAYSADGTRAGSATASFRITGAKGSFLYMANGGSTTVPTYAIGADGLLTPLNAPAFGAGFTGIAATPNGSFLYVTNFDTARIVAYRIGSDGLLTLLNTPTFPTGLSPEAIAITPNGSFLYVTNESSFTVSAYAVGPAGELSPLSTPTFPTGFNPLGIAVTPNGSFLYVTNLADGTISEFAIGSGGLLTPLSVPTVAAGFYPFGMAIAPDGSLLYVTNGGSNTVSGYSIGLGGLLTPLRIPTFSTGSLPQGIAITPNGSFLYVTNAGSRTVSGYAVGSDGYLTPLSTSPFVAGDGPWAIAVAPNGSFLYVTNYYDSTVSAYTIGPGGLLTPLSIAVPATAINTNGIVIVPQR